jgi:septal ring factor EnvC (AmiA/AmiB activator)
VQIHERALLKVQQNRQETEEQITTAKDKLQAQRKSLAQLVLALQRLDRLPPQALLARPSAPIDTARSFYLLQHVMPDISKRAAEVKTTLDQLASLQSTYDTQEASLQKENDELTLKRGILQKSLNQRQALLKQTEKNQNAATRKAEALAKQAEDLRDLMSSLSKTEASVPKSSFGSSVKSWFGGKSTLPVEGKVKIGYGDTMPGGGQSQGLSIAAASGAIVTAPSDGIVRFAGPFRQYKLLVIIQHNNGEHSLLGGLQEIYTRTGEKVAAGEPVGKLPAKIEGGDTQQASLYYERRRNGKPIDPRNARG